MSISIEQMCRDLLHLAIRDDLVRHPEDVFDGTLSSELEPPAWSSGDLCGMANLLQSYLRREAADGNEPITAEWLKSEGIPRILVIDASPTGDVELDDVLIIDPSNTTTVLIRTTCAAGFMNFHTCVTLPHIKTRSQLRQLIALLAPDWKAGS